MLLYDGHLRQFPSKCHCGEQEPGFQQKALWEEALWEPYGSPMGALWEEAVSKRVLQNISAQTKIFLLVYKVLIGIRSKYISDLREHYEASRP